MCIRYAKTCISYGLQGLAWALYPVFLESTSWLHLSVLLVSFEVASANLPTKLEEDRIASYNFSKAWPHIRAQLTQRIPYKRWYNLACPAPPTHTPQLCHFGASWVRQQGPAVRSQIYAEVYGNHWRYEQHTDSTESLLTLCLQFSLLRRQ